MIVIADTSPINYLVQIDADAILPALYGEVLIPPAVLGELKHVKAPVRVRSWASNLPNWVTIRIPKPLMRTEVQRLDAGEREAIELAFEFGADLLLIDELKGRKAAQKLLDIPVRGTLGLIQEAHSKGILDGYAALHRLRKDTTCFIHPDLQRSFLSSLEKRR